MELDLWRRVEKGDGCVVFWALLDVIGVDQLAEHVDGVGAAEADGCAGEADTPSIGQRLGQITGISLFKSVLRAVRLVRDDHQVRALGQNWMLHLHRLAVWPGLQAELLDGGENDLAAL